MRKLLLILCLIMIPAFSGAVTARPIVQDLTEVNQFVSDVIGGTEIGLVAIDVSQAELNALLSFYEATGGDNWTTNTGWGETGTVNDWFQVNISSGHVNWLRPGNNNLVGDAGTTLTALSGLGSLKITVAPNLTGIDVSGLTNLTFLHFESIGSSSIDISTCTKLTYIILYGNSYSQTTIDNILTDVDSAGLSNGTLNVGGNNAAPSATGLSSRDALVVNGWIVTVTAP